MLQFDAAWQQPPIDGDPLTRLYLDHAPALSRSLRSRVRDGEAADDIVQEAFLRLAREVAAGRGPENAPGWLFHVARNLAVSRARRLATARRLAPLLQRPSASDDPLSLVIAGEHAQAIADAVAELRPADRIALEMAAHGHPTAVIAHRLGRTELATRALLCRTRRRLRPLIAEHPHMRRTE